MRCHCLSTEIAANPTYERGNKLSHPPKRKRLGKRYSCRVVIRVNASSDTGICCVPVHSRCTAASPSCRAERWPAALRVYPSLRVLRGENCTEQKASEAAGSCWRREGVSLGPFRPKADVRCLPVSWCLSWAQTPNRPQCHDVLRCRNMSGNGYHREHIRPCALYPCKETQAQLSVSSAARCWYGRK